jgi:hypothetical protein
VVISAVLAACASTTPTERERAVGKLPAAAQVVAAADGTALAPLRPVIDAARPFIPANLGCVVDAALTSEAVAVAVEPRAGTTIVIVTRAHVARCPALSRIASDTFVATIGAGALADTTAASPLRDSRWSRARRYLLDDPIAIAIDREGQRLIAVAQPKPLAGWLSIDAVDTKPIEQAMRSWLDRQRTTALGSFAGNVTVEARGSQLLVRTTKPSVEELALLTVDVLRTLDAPSPKVPSTPFALACPTGDTIVRCNGTTAIVRSLATTLSIVSTADSAPVVAGGDVIGIRLLEDADVLLRRGDIILGLDGHRITSPEQLFALARYLSERATLAVRRDGVDVVIDLRE